MRTKQTSSRFRGVKGAAQDVLLESTGENAHKNMFDAAVRLLDVIAKLIRSNQQVNPQVLAHLEQLELSLSAHRQFYREGDSKALPSKAPALWLARVDRKISPPDFLRLHYKDAMSTKRFSRLHLKRIDKSLYAALANWMLKNGPLPSDVDLPTKKELNDRLLKEASPVSSRLPPDVREARRLYQLSRRRSQMR